MDDARASPDRQLSYALVIVLTLSAFVAHVVAERHSKEFKDIAPPTDLALLLENVVF